MIAQKSEDRERVKNMLLLKMLLNSSQSRKVSSLEVTWSIPIW